MLSLCLQSNFCKWITCLHAYTHLFNGPFSGWAGTRKEKPVWILLKQETLSGSGVSWAICKSAPSSRQITMPARHHSVFYMPDALSAAQPTASKHWRQWITHLDGYLSGQLSEVSLYRIEGSLLQGCSQIFSVRVYRRKSEERNVFAK